MKLALIHLDRFLVAAVVTGTISLIIFGRVPHAFAQCAPDCKVCLLNVCSDAPDAPAGGRKPGSGAQPPGPVSDDPDPLVKREGELKGLKPSDTSEPVSDWVGLSGRDFVNLFFYHFIMAGNCMDVRTLPAEIQDVQRRQAARDLSDEERNFLHKKQSELGDKLENAQSAIAKRKHDCSSTWKRMGEGGSYYGGSYWK